MCSAHNDSLSVLLENRMSPSLKKLVMGEPATIQRHELPYLLSWMDWQELAAYTGPTGHKERESEWANRGEESQEGSDGNE